MQEKYRGGRAVASVRDRIGPESLISANVPIDRALTALPVAAPEAEQAVLSAILMDAKALDETRSAGLTESHFYSERHAKIYAAMISLKQRGIAIDPLMLMHELQRDLEAIGGKDYIGYLIDVVPTAANVAYHASIVIDSWQLRSVQEAAHRVLRAVGSGASPSEIAEQFTRNVQGAIAATPHSSSTAKLYQTLGELREDPTLLLPPQADIPFLAFEERVTMLVAREKDGKTTFGCHAAAAKTKGVHFLGEPTVAGTVLWLALEGHVGDVARTLVSAGADDERLLVVHRRLPDDLDTIMALVREIGPAVVFIDTLASAADGLVKDPKDSSEWTPVMNRLGDIARDGKTAIVLNHHATKSDGNYRDSTAIGAGVDMILTMRRGDPQQPSVRVISAVGRFPLRDYAVRYADDAGFSLVNGDPASRPVSKEDEVVAFIDANPGSGTAKVRNGLGGKAAEVDAAISSALAKQRIVDDGTSDRHRYRCPTSDRQTGSGTRGVVPHNSNGDNAETSNGTRCLSQSDVLGTDTGTGGSDDGADRHACAGGCGFAFSAPGITCLRCRQRPDERDISQL